MTRLSLKAAFAALSSSFLLTSAPVPAFAQTPSASPSPSANTVAEDWKCRPPALAAQQVEDGKWDVLSRATDMSGEWVIMMSRDDNKEWQIVTGKDVLCLKDKGTDLVVNTLPSSGPYVDVSAPASQMSFIMADDAEENSGAEAQEPKKPLGQCFPKEGVIHGLHGQFRENVVFNGQRSEEGSGLIIMASPSGQWTALVTPPNKSDTACLAAAGHNFKLSNSLYGKVIINNKIIDVAPKPGI